jgi:predicted membrane protein
MRQSQWLYPIVEIVHILGFVTLVGSVAMFDLRLLGLSPRLPVAEMARHLLRWSLGSLLLVLPSGLMMFSAHATEFADNTAFRVKMLLLVTAAANAVWFHRTSFRSVADWNTGVSPPLASRVAAGVSLAVWIGVIACGRLLAYL